MSTRFRLRSLWRNLPDRRNVDRDLDDELAALYAELTDEKVRAGMPPDAARRAATIELGRVSSLFATYPFGRVTVTRGDERDTAEGSYVTGDAPGRSRRWRSTIPVH